MTGLLMTDQQRERYIRECGLLMVAAMTAGNRQEAMDWMQAQTLAIAGRSPAQKARMTAAIDKAIDEGNDYFSVTGALNGAQLKAA